MWPYNILMKTDCLSIFLSVRSHTQNCNIFDFVSVQNVTSSNWEATINKQSIYLNRMHPKDVATSIYDSLKAEHLQIFLFNSLQKKYMHY